jgi:hypothetical protein
MKNFNHYNFKNLPNNQVLKIKLKTNDEWLYVKHVSKLVLQAFQPYFTPIKTYHLELIKDLELYSTDVEDDHNYYFLSVEQIDIIMWTVVVLTPTRFSRFSPSRVSQRGPCASILLP